jgi:hypothetical protein
MPDLIAGSVARRLSLACLTLCNYAFSFRQTHLAA